MNLRDVLSGRWWFDFLSSMRLAVVSMAVLAVACAVATFYESAHGTAAAQRMFYRTRWFTFVLALLAVGVLLSMLKRLPWRMHQAGFVFAHVGILLILGGSLVSLYRGLDGSLALFEGDTGDRVALQERALAVALPSGLAATVPVEFESNPPTPDRPQRFALPGGATLVADDYARHVVLQETVEEGAGGSPALHIVLTGTFGEQEGWLLASGDHSKVEFGPLALTLAAAGTEEEAARALAGTGNTIAFVRGPGERLRYGMRSTQGASAAGEVEVGRAVPTPWMGMSFTVKRALGSALAVRTAFPATAPEAENRRQPGVRVHLEDGSGAGTPRWIPWTESAALPFAGGRAEVAFRDREAPLPFKMTLLQFRSQKYPGSAMAATYESRVRVDDPELGVSEHLISMNHPLHYRGYIFFQASFVEGAPMMSILSVSRSPGLPLVYAGTALVSLGVAWMFYLKPLLARRQGRRALEAHRHSKEAAAVPPPALTGAPATPARG